MSRIISFVFISLIMSGCVSTQNVAIDQDSSGKFQNKSISTTSRDLPDFAAMTAGKAMFGVIGATAMISAGNEIVRNNQIEDPANYIAINLITSFAEQFKSVIAANNTGNLTSENPAKISELYPNLNYLIDVRTINWSFVYYPTKWGKYRIIYSAKLRLINTKTGRVTAEGFCSRVPEDASNAPTRDAMLADKAALLKSELRIAANLCINEFKSNVLRLPVTELKLLDVNSYAAEASLETSATTDSPNDETDVDTTVMSKYPELILKLNSASSVEMREAAKRIGEEKLYADEAIILASIGVLEKALHSEIGKKEKYRIDGLSWCALNLGHSGDSRSVKILQDISESSLPKKLRKHAIAGLEIRRSEK